jgi:DNA-binding transcriptional MerR regulator
MTATFTPSQVSKMTGVSVAGVRNYADDPRYDQWFSDHARRIIDPKVRKYTADDVRLIAFIGSKTKGEGLTHEDVLAALAGGDLDQFDSWTEGDDPEPLEADAGADSTELATGAQTAALMAFLSEFRDREQVTRAEVDDLRTELRAREETYQEVINDLQQQLGAAQGELKAVKEERERWPGWLKWITGG